MHQAQASHHTCTLPVSLFQHFRIVTSYLEVVEAIGSLLDVSVATVAGSGGGLSVPCSWTARQVCFDLSAGMHLQWFRCPSPSYRCTCR